MASGMNNAEARPRRRTQEERSEEMRARLLNASIEVLKRNGYSGFRIADVAAEAGVSRGAQIHHYPTKDDLVTASLEHVYENVRRETEVRAAEPLADEDVIDAAIADATRYFFSDSFSVSLDILRSAAKNPNIADRAREISVRYRVAAEHAWVDRLVASGITPKDAHVLLWLLYSVLRGLAVRRETSLESDREKQVIALVTQLVHDHAERLRAPTGQPKSSRPTGKVEP